ncbi:hypothetical protein ISN45_Aa07g006890, partial [Arabidopsis thaliana x Arabidopsis arenosa]
CHSSSESFAFLSHKHALVHRMIGSFCVYQSRTWWWRQKALDCNLIFSPTKSKRIFSPYNTHKPM